MFTTYVHLSRSPIVCPPKFFCPLEDPLAFQHALSHFSTPPNFEKPSKILLNPLGFLALFQILKHPLHL